MDVETDFFYPTKFNEEQKNILKEGLKDAMYTYKKLEEADVNNRALVHATGGTVIPAGYGAFRILQEPHCCPVTTRLTTLFFRCGSSICAQASDVKITDAQDGHIPL